MTVTTEDRVFDTVNQAYNARREYIALGASRRSLRKHIVTVGDVCKVVLAIDEAHSMEIAYRSGQFPLLSSVRIGK
jgi:hypothetical protein